MKKEHKDTTKIEDEIEASLKDEHIKKETTIETKNLVELLTKMKEENTITNIEKIIPIAETLINDLNQAQKEKNDYLAILQRFKADFENYKKRMEKDADANVRYSSERILSKIFEPIEDISRAIKFAKENSQETIPFEGIEIIYNKLTRVLDDESVEIIAPKQGDKFDPKYHEAVMVDESGKYDSDVVVQLFEQGYMIKGRVFRAAKVMVSVKTNEEK